MLGKLLKYEYKATSRYFIGLYIVLALLTSLDKGTQPFVVCDG